MSAHASVSETRYAALLRRTREWVEMGRFDAAADCCREAIECMPDRAGPRGVLAQALASAGRLDEAAEAADAALERAPRDRLMLHLAASIALRRSLPRAAIALARRVLQIDPHDQRALADIAFAMDPPGDGPAADRAAPGEAVNAESLLDLDRVVRTSEIGVPAGYPSLESFNQHVAADVVAFTDRAVAPPGAAAPRVDPVPAGVAPTGAVDGQTPLVGGRRFYGLLDLEAQWVAPLREALRRAVDDYVAALDLPYSHPVMTGRPPLRKCVAWANVMSRGDHERAHIHEAGWLSGIYYVATPATGEIPASADSGTAGAGGALLLGGHCSVPDGGRPRRRLEPHPGQVVLFPSYLCHRTEPVQGTGRRISIAFDIQRF